MADKYVKKTGNDSSGNGSDGNPYLTIAKALSVCTHDDRVIIGAGTYEESNIGGAVTLNRIKIVTLGDGQVIVDASGGSTATATGHAFQARTGWVFDGSTGSNLQNLEIIGAGVSCIAPRSPTTNNRAWSVKHCILTGRGDRRDNDTDENTQHGIFRCAGISSGTPNDHSTIRNSVLRNFLYTFHTATNNSGEVRYYNNILYSCGYSGSDYRGINNNTGDSTQIFFNTIIDFTGSYAIYCPGNGSEVKNNLISHCYLTQAGIMADGSDGDGEDNFTGNNVYVLSSGTPEKGAFEDFQGTSIHSSNKELDPMFNLANREENPQNPWRNQLVAGVSGDFSLKPNIYHYEGSSRSTTGTDLATAGTDLSSYGLTTDFSGSSRSSTPTIGALETTDEYLFETPPDGDSITEDKIKKDFTINHYNRISAENPRNVDQIPFSKLFRSPANLRDRVTAYKLTKESK